MDFILEENFQQLNEHDTREEFYNGELRKSNLDHIYSNTPDQIKNITAETLSTSDHKILKFRKYSKIKDQRPDCTRRRVYKNMSIEAFLTDIHTSSINRETTKSSQIDVSADTFSKEFSKILDDHAPIRTIQNHTNYCPALSTETKYDIECRNILRKAVKSKTCDEALPQYKPLEKMVKHKVRRDKQNFNENRINDSDPKKSWRVAKSILGINKNKETIEIINDNGVTENDPRKVANLMNDFFIKKTEEIREQSKTPQQDPIKRVRDQVGDKLTNMEPFNMKPINSSKLREIISKSKGGPSCGYENIDGRVLKLAAPLVEESLMHLIKLSIMTNQFATQWKPLNVHPMHKKGDPLLRENQRPLSHIQEVGKLTERVVAEQIMDYMIKNKLMKDEQHGAIKYHSPHTALAVIQDILLSGAEDKMLTSILLI